MPKVPLTRPNKNFPAVEAQYNSPETQTYLTILHDIWHLIISLQTLAADALEENIFQSF
jgi:hypothetical protein